MRRINDKFRAGWRFYISLFTIRKTRQDQTAAGRPLHRIYRASPHSRGGASYAVTHSRRKYHHTHMQFVARCCAIAALRRWPCSLRPPSVRPPFTGDHPCVPAARLRAYRMYLIALFSCSQAFFLRTENTCFYHLISVKIGFCSLFAGMGKTSQKILENDSFLKIRFTVRHIFQQSLYWLLFLFLTS